MRLGNLGVCPSDVLEAQAALRNHAQAYCNIMANLPKVTPGALPPWFQPPKNSTRWKPYGALVIPAGVQTGLDILVFEERVPLGYDGLITTPSNAWNGTGFVEGSGDITWRIKKDRVFIPYFDTITTTQGNLAVPVDVIGQGIRILSGQLLQYFVNFLPGSEGRLNVGGATLCALTGYIWPRDRVI